MKHSKEQFIERLLKLSYHIHEIDRLPSKDKQYLNMLLIRDNLQFLYEDENSKTEEDN